MGTVRGPLKVKNCTIKIKGDRKEEGSPSLSASVLSPQLHLWYSRVDIFKENSAKEGMDFVSKQWKANSSRTKWAYCCFSLTNYEHL